VHPVLVALATFYTTISERLAQFLSGSLK